MFVDDGEGEKWGLYWQWRGSVLCLGKLKPNSGEDKVKRSELVNKRIF